MIAMSILIFALGLIIGSFLNVCIYRIPQELSIHSSRRSFCPTCRTTIRFYDNIPVLSYLFLRGRCRHCNTEISNVYPLVELTTGILFLLSLSQFGPTLALLHSCLFISLLIPIAWIDARWYIIPNAIILVGLIAGTAVTLLIALTRHDPSYLIDHLIGAVAGGASMALIAVLGTFLFRKQVALNPDGLGAMGGGDIKLMLLIGLFLGGWPHLLIVIMASAFTGSIVGLSLVALGKKSGGGSRIPYGPFLVIGALLDLFWSSQIWNWYLRLIGWA
jgi:leader peptidase (prepilin peptidase)/N-methyltransferase